MDIMPTEIAAHKSNLLFDLSDQLFDTAPYEMQFIYFFTLRQIYSEHYGAFKLSKFIDMGWTKKKRWLETDQSTLILDDDRKHEACW